MSPKSVYSDQPWLQQWYQLLPEFLPLNLGELPDDKHDFTWAQAINTLTLVFNQAICLRAGTAPVALITCTQQSWLEQVTNASSSLCHFVPVYNPYFFK